VGATAALIAGVVAYPPGSSPALPGVTATNACGHGPSSHPSRSVGEEIILERTKGVS